MKNVNGSSYNSFHHNIDDDDDIYNNNNAKRIMKYLIENKLAFVCVCVCKWTTISYDAYDTNYSV